MAELCNEHGLVLGDDNKCVLCRRAMQPMAWLAKREQTAGGKLLNYLLLLCLSLGLAAVAYLAIMPKPASVVRSSRSVAPPAQTAATTAEATPEPAQPTATMIFLDEEEEPPLLPRRPRVLLTPAQRVAMVSARASIEITMYQTHWCYICDHARDQLTAKGVQLTEYDIERDPQAEKRHMALNPTGSVPVFTLQDTTLIGFNPYTLGLLIDEIALASLNEEGAEPPP
jgi:glutaredoxin